MNKKVKALCLAAILALNSNAVLAGPEFYVGYTYIANHEFSYEGNYFGINDFLGGSSWYDSGENVTVGARLLVRPEGCDTDTFYETNKYVEKTAYELSKITESDMGDISMYTADAVRFTHYANIAATSTRIQVAEKDAYYSIE